MDEYLLPPSWKHVNLYPFLKDPRGHATDRKEPGGWIAKVELSSGKWTLVAAGFRNAFDMAFNEDGELFPYDSDMGNGIWACHGTDPLVFVTSLTEVNSAGEPVPVNGRNTMWIRWLLYYTWDKDPLLTSFL
jgi:hypothetical protein